MSAAVLFQNMPPLSPEEYQALETSIREHGVQVPIVVDENRTVIDGHHRQKIAQELGIECPKRVVFDKTEAEKRTLALSLNLDRRHLNREQRRALIAESIKADPELSNRQHAERTGVSDKTVGTVREELVRRAEIPHVDQHTDSLGRKQPARVDKTTGEILDDEPAESLSDWRHRTLRDAEDNGKIVPLTGPGSVSDPAPSKVTGLDGKEYTRPAPKPEPSKPRRAPLPDAFQRATYAVTQKAEALSRLVDDDRFTQNAEKVATASRSDLLRAIDVLQHVAQRLNQSQNPS